VLHVHHEQQCSVKYGTEQRLRNSKKLTLLAAKNGFCVVIPTATASAFGYLIIRVRGQLVFVACIEKSRPKKESVYKGLAWGG
jgi:hypothetical protein